MLSSAEIPSAVEEKLDHNNSSKDTSETSQNLTESNSASTPIDNKIVDANTETAITEEVIEPVSKKETPNIEIKTKRVSGLSLSSLKAKKEHSLNKKDDAIDERTLPRSPFSEEEMQKHWADFVEIIDKEGRKILASNLHSDKPKLRDENTIWIELPNGTMKKEIEREQFDLMEYLRLKLDNHFISLKITVNETTSTKFAFTPEEKYKKLREKNPVIDFLRQEFDLDLS